MRVDERELSKKQELFELPVRKFDMLAVRRSSPVSVAVFSSPSLSLACSDTRNRIATVSSNS
jgi:hypothetical protein